MPAIDELKWLLKPLVNTNVMAAVFFLTDPLKRKLTTEPLVLSTVMLIL